MAKEEKKKAKTKRPTALKRDIRNSKRRLINKIFKSKIRTTFRAFETSLKNNNQEQTQEALNNVYSMMDQSIKRGIYKQNKAARLKANAYQKFLSQKA